MSGFHVFRRRATNECPAGITVSKHRHLPAGDFGLTEFIWPEATLWFVDEDQFTADERQAAYTAYVLSGLEELTK